MDYSMYLPNYSVGEDVFKLIPEICKKYGKEVVFIGGKTAMEKSKPYLEKALANSNIIIKGFLWYGGDATYENAEALAKNKLVIESDMIFAVGGGRAIDTGKYVRELTKKPFFTIPTIAATCAAITKNSVMYYPNGEQRNLYFYKETPIHSFINTKIIAEAPEEYLWAGIGDTIAKYFESDFSARGDILDHSNSMGIRLGKLCWSEIKQYGEKAYKDCKNNIVSSELESVVLANIVTTGIVSGTIIHKYYNAGLAHALYYAFTILPQIEEKHLHGEVVAYGVLVLAMLDEEYRKKYLDDLIEFYRKIKLPLKLRDLDVDIKEIIPVIEKGIETGEVEHSPYEIGFEKIKDAIEKLETYS